MRERERGRKKEGDRERGGKRERGERERDCRDEHLLFNYTYSDIYK